MAKTGKTTSPSSAERAALRRSLLRWYAAHARDLPWRRTQDPYAIWVSEVMLQQTQVATVIPYYERWLRRFPSVTALARAREADVLHAWQGLGYYSRAKRLLAGARAVAERHGGEVPADLEALRALPGVGRYTAGAIASIAHDARAALVDGNVERVLCRVLGLKGDPKRAPLSARLWELADALLPARGARDFNQALMELGATVCTPRSPDCERCPWGKRCVARAKGRQAELPGSGRRARVTAVSMVAAVVERNGRFLVARVPEDAPRWAGLWQFPNAELGRGERPVAALARAVGAEVRDATHALRVVHSVTRYRISLEVFRCAAPGATGTWKRPTELETLAMPAAHRRIADHLTAAPAPARARARARP